MHQNCSCVTCFVVGKRAWERATSFAYDQILKSFEIFLLQNSSNQSYESAFDPDKTVFTRCHHILKSKTKEPQKAGFILIRHKSSKNQRILNFGVMAVRFMS